MMPPSKQNLKKMNTIVETKNGMGKTGTIVNEAGAQIRTESEETEVGAERSIEAETGINLNPYNSILLSTTFRLFAFKGSNIVFGRYH